ncbi:MAG: hypothetical protein V4506_12865 [Bacteroidota bacterium]
MKTTQKLQMLFKKNQNKYLVFFAFLLYMYSCNTYSFKEANLKVEQFYNDHNKEVSELIDYCNNLQVKDTFLRVNYMSKWTPKIQAFNSIGFKTDFVFDQKFEYFFSSNSFSFTFLKDSMETFYFYNIRNQRENGLSLIHFERNIEKNNGDTISGIPVVDNSLKREDLLNYYCKINNNWFILSKGEK